MSGPKRMPAATTFKDRLFIQTLQWRCLRITRHPRSRKGTSLAAVGFGSTPRMPPRTTAKGLRLFLDAEQQRAWLKGEATPTDGERADCDAIEQRFKYAARFEKLLQRPQAQEVLEILRIYAEHCIPIPRTTERFYWSVSCLPSTDKTFARVN